MCSGCFDDAQLRAWIGSHSNCTKCDFCAAESLSTTTLGSLVLRLIDCIYLEYSIEQDELFIRRNLFPYASAESWTTEHLLFEELGLRLPNDREGELRSAILEQIGDWRWREVEWNPLSEGCSILSRTWEAFCNLVQFKRRFFFMPRTEEEPDPMFVYVDVREMLGKLRGFCLIDGLFRRVPVGTLLYRAEFQGDPDRRLTSADFRFPLTPESTTFQVLNPPGIPALYVAESIASVLAPHTKGGWYAIAVYRVTSALSVLDLTEVGAVPSLFGGPESNWQPRRCRLLVHKLRDSVTMQARQESSTALDHLPTQIFAEYFRVTPHDIQGIRYPGSSSTTAPRIAIFEESAAEDGSSLPLQSLELSGVEQILWDPAVIRGS